MISTYNPDWNVGWILKLFLSKCDAKLERNIYEENSKLYKYFTALCTLKYFYAQHAYISFTKVAVLLDYPLTGIYPLQNMHYYYI